MSKIPIQTKNNSTMAKIITIKEKNTLAIADTITIFSKKIILLTSKISNKSSTNFSKFSHLVLYTLSQVSFKWTEAQLS